jgi:hypothetical protein
MVLLQEVTQHLHPVWSNAYFYLFIASTIIFFITSFIFIKTLRKKIEETKLMQQQYLARVDNVRKEHSDTLEKIRVEMLKREEERTRQWMESEKETLHVLNGVSTLLELDKRLSGTENERMLKMMSEIRDRIMEIEKLLQSDTDSKNEQKNTETQGN